MSLLVAADISVMIDARTILDRIGVTIRRGELVGLIGPNGAGKTTLLRVLANLLKANAGTVALDAVNLAHIPPARLARRLAYLAQGAPAHWPLRVDKVVALGRLPHLAWWQQPGADDRAIIAHAMRMAEVEHLRERVVTTLSGGERMRVLLARIFASQPELILADEPVAALDPYHQLQVMELLRAHAHRVDADRPQGAVLAVLHDLNLAARFCDRLILLAGGRLICAGSVREVLSQRHLHSVYGIEALSFEHGEQFTVIPWQRIR
jgi:ABC-type cobalamin/Fe3+-siderophores transport system ATPase subunit